MYMKMYMLFVMDKHGHLFNFTQLKIVCKGPMGKTRFPLVLSATNAKINGHFQINHRGFPIIAIICPYFCCRKNLQMDENVGYKHVCCHQLWRVGGRKGKWAVARTCYIVEQDQCTDKLTLYALLGGWGIQLPISYIYACLWPLLLTACWFFCMWHLSAC